MNFARTTIIYGLTGALGRFGALVTLPVYTRYISQADFGRLEFLISIYAIILILTEMQLVSGYIRDYYASKNNRVLFNSITMIYGLMWAFWGAIFVTMFLVYKPFRDAVLPHEFAAILVASLFANLVQLWLADRRMAHAVKPYVIVSITQMLVGPAVGLGLVLFVSAEPWSVLLGTLVGNGLAALPALKKLNPARRNLINAAELKQLLSYSLPTVPAVLATWGRTQASRPILLVALGASSVAIFGVADKLAMIFLVVFQAFRLAWDPVMVKAADVKGGDRVIKAGYDLYAVYGFGVAAGLVTLGPALVDLIVPPAYAVAKFILPMLVVAYYIEGLTSITAANFVWTRRMKYNAALSVLSVGMGMLFLILTVSTLGPAAAGIAAVLAAVLRNLLFFAVGVRIGPIKFRAASLIWPYLSGSALLALAIIIPRYIPESIFLQTLALAGISAALVVAILFSTLGDKPFRTTIQRLQELG